MAYLFFQVQSGRVKCLKSMVQQPIQTVWCNAIVPEPRMEKTKHVQMIKNN